MANKTLPFDQQQLAQIIKEYGTPFHIYDEKSIRENARRLQAAFRWAPGYKEYFAVKATPNPSILRLLREEGIGADCSSLPELRLAKVAGILGEDIIFSSNNTPIEEYLEAIKMGAILNLDDISHIAYLEQYTVLPEVISFRYNPGPELANSNDIIGNPMEAKYGLTKKQIYEAYERLSAKGIKRFGIHTMVISNELNANCFVNTAEMMFDLIVEIAQRTGVRIEFVDLGGGIGIDYKPEDKPVNLEEVSAGIKRAYENKICANNLDPLRITMECGRMITGPYGYLVTKVLHKKETYKNYVGVDACMTDLMRPALYKAYHHISVVGKETLPKDQIYDVTGSLCENNDKFAIDRALPVVEIDDVLVIHDTGAHGHAMGFNYNGKLRSAELLLQPDGTVKMIRRAETMEDYFSTIVFEGESDIQKEAAITEGKK